MQAAVNREDGMKNTVPIKNNYEFLRAYKKGRFFAGKYVILYVLGNKQGVNRLGITISRKFGKSVKRNRMRRLIKENYRVYEGFLKEGVDLVFVARKQDAMPGFNDIGREMKFLFKRLDLFKNDIETE